MTKRELLAFAEAKLSNQLACCCLEGEPTHEEAIVALCQFYLDEIYGPGWEETFKEWEQQPNWPTSPSTAKLSKENK